MVRKLWVAPEDVDNRDLRITIHVDTAFKTLERLERGDSSVIAVVGHSRTGDGMVYALEAKHSNTWTADQFFDELVALLQRLKKSGTTWPYALTDEREMGGKEGLFLKVLEARCAASGSSPACCHFARDPRSSASRRRRRPACRGSRASRQAA